MTKYKRLWDASGMLYHGHKVPRKLKKIIIGKKISKSKLKKMLSNVKVTINKYPEVSKIDPNTFCPSCGCDKIHFIDYGVSYPEIWYEEYCLRCKSYVGGADNSVYSHILEDIDEWINK